MKTLKLCFLGAALLASSSAVAGRTSQSFGVRLVVEDACHVETPRFATVDQQGRGGPWAQLEGVEVKCRMASPHAVEVAVGPVPMPSVAPAGDGVPTLVVSY